MSYRQIVFTELNKAELLEVPEREIKDNEVLVKTIVSTISCGTEKANITGDLNVAFDLPPQEEAVFPRYAGYSTSGIVEKVGKDVKSVKTGDRVAMWWSVHKSYNIMSENRIVKLDGSISFEDAAIAHIGTFPMAAIRKTQLEIGESMLVMGLGILGQLAVKFAKLAGAVPVIAVDPNPERRAFAIKMGADFAFDPFDKDFVQNVKSVTDGKGVNTAIEVTGLGEGLNQCLDCMKSFGRIALLGCTRDKNFNVDYYRKVHGPGITLIGAHTLARPSNESSRHMFSTEDDMKTILNLMKYGRLSLKEYVAETHAPEQCTEVFSRLINDKNFPVFVQFDWRKLK
ncbi:MAG: zinc-binding dehydrogenase [Clostridia bacterium]|nr:zinc-binding dehydrogenase [Clostridia bacterium]